MNDKTPTYNPDGPVHTFFGLTYSSYQVVPRVLAQSMPHEWQARFVACMEEMQEAFGHLGEVGYDVQTAEEVYANELTEEQRGLTGVTGGWDAYQDREIFWDRDGNEIPGYQRVMVPVPDPLPSYSRGRTRVPRKDQLPETGWFLWDSEGRWMGSSTAATEDGWKAVSVPKSEEQELRSRGCMIDRLDPAGWRAYYALRATLQEVGGRDRWLAQKAAV